jgi:2-polyprenyl-3-methyl-5-hydroxy-6-metoxy-1,4-benzoquinol methylase
MRRRLTPEIMDDPAVPRDELETSLRYLRVINRRWGGAEALLRHLRVWSVRWPKDRPVTLLDIATGSADLPLAAVAWARGAGFDLRVTGVDLHETTLDCARRHVADHPALAGSITLERGDARTLMEKFPPGAFDYVHAGLFLHHLPEIEVLTVLRIMDRLARAGIVWNDLVRSRLCRLVVGLAVVGRARMVRHDATVSVEAGFTRAEVRDFAKRLDLGYARYRRGPMVHRFTLAGERQGAWG